MDIVIYYREIFIINWVTPSVWSYFLFVSTSVHGILQARTLEWVAIPFSRGSFWSRDWTQVSYTAVSLPPEPLRKPLLMFLKALMVQTSSLPFLCLLPSDILSLKFECLLCTRKCARLCWEYSWRAVAKRYLLVPYTSGVLFLPGYWVQNRELLALELVCLISSSDMNTSMNILGHFFLILWRGKGYIYVGNKKETNWEYIVKIGVDQGASNTESLMDFPSFLFTACPKHSSSLPLSRPAPTPPVLLRG